jgi:hypothetical protein
LVGWLVGWFGLVFGFFGLLYRRNQVSEAEICLAKQAKRQGTLQNVDMWMSQKKASNL